MPLRPLGLCQLELMLLVGSTILTYIGLRERGQTNQRPGPPGWGLSAGLTTLPCKTTHVTETSLGKSSHCRPGGLMHCGASMNGSGESQLGTRARRASLLDATTHL